MYQLINTYVLLSLVTLLINVPVSYAGNYESEKEEAKTLFLKAVEGDKHSLRTATRRFKSLKRKNSGDPVVAAYLGACTSLQARDASQGPEKMRFAESAISQIDKVIATLPLETEENRQMILEAKLVAANTYINLPASFNRLKKGERLVNEIMDHHGFQYLSSGMKTAVYRSAAESALKRNDVSAYNKYTEKLNGISLSDN